MVISETVAAVAAKIVELTVAPIGRQIGYLLCYGDNLNKLENEAEELRTTKERIDIAVEAERRSVKEIFGDVENLQRRVKEILEEAHKLSEDRSHASVRCWKWSFPNLKSRYLLGRNACKMAPIITELKEKCRLEATSNMGYTPHLKTTNNFPTTRGSDMLESRKSMKEDIISSLKDPKVNKVGVYGIQGMGKTTLVKEVAKIVNEEKMFDEVVMVNVSQTSLEGIQDEIAEQLGLHAFKDISSSIDRVNRLCERIKMKNIVLILDDVCEEFDWEKLGIPSGDMWGKYDAEKVGISQKADFKVCKLLLTSTLKDILEKNDSQKTFLLSV